MNYANLCRLGCVLLVLCGACSDDDEAATDAPVSTKERDGSAGDDSPSADDDDSTGDEPGDEPGDNRGTAGGGDAPADAGGSDPGDEPEMTDAATVPPEQTPDAGGTPEQPSDAAVTADAAAPVTDCESLSACCEQLSERMRMVCESAVEAANDDACVRIGNFACGDARDAGMPTVMPCEEVLECCAALPERERIACEAAAAAPAGRACDRAVEMYCQ